MPLVALLMAVSACSTNYGGPFSIRAASLSSGVCTLHHVALREVTVYEFAPLRSATFDPGPAPAIHDQYPNSLLPEYEFKRDEFNTKPTRYRYCPLCQQAYENEQQALSTKAAQEAKREREHGT